MRMQRLIDKLVVVMTVSEGILARGRQRGPTGAPAAQGAMEKMMAEVTDQAARVSAPAAKEKAAARKMMEQSTPPSGTSSATPAAAAGGGGRPPGRGAKRGRVDGKATSQELEVLVAKLTLQNAGDIRMLKGVITHCALLDSKDPLCGELEKANKKFQAIRAQQKDAGSPHILLWAALVMALIKSGRGEVQDLEELRKHAEIKKEELQQMIHTCFFAPKPEGNGKPKLLLAVSTEKALRAQAAVLRILAVNGADVRHGPAPKSPLERAVSKALEAAVRD